MMSSLCVHSDALMMSSHYVYFTNMMSQGLNDNLDLSEIFREGTFLPKQFLPFIVDIIYRFFLSICYV